MRCWEVPRCCVYRISCGERITFLMKLTNQFSIFSSFFILWCVYWGLVQCWTMVFQYIMRSNLATPTSTLLHVYLVVCLSTNGKRASLALKWQQLWATALGINWNVLTWRTQSAPRPHVASFWSSYSRQAHHFQDVLPTYVISDTGKKRGSHIPHK